MKRIIALILALIMVFSLVACGNSGGEENTPSNEGSGEAENQPEQGGESTDKLPHDGAKVSMLMPTLGDAFLVTIGDKVTELAKNENIEVTVYGADGDIATQIQQIENSVAMGFDAIILVPLNVNACEAAVASARENGVKVVLCSDDPKWDADILWLSVAEVIGEMVAEMAIKWVDETFPDAGAGEIKFAWFTTSMDRPDGARRCQTMYDVLMADERFECVFRKDDLLDTTSAIDAMQECLSANRDINVVITYADAQGMGANSAIMADDSLDKTKIGVFSGSSTAESEQLVADSANNESVLRGLVTFGTGDSFFQGYVDCVCAALDGTFPVDYAMFQAQDTCNSVGYSASFDPTEYAKTYANNGHPDGYDWSTVKTYE